MKCDRYIIIIVALLIPFNCFSQEELSTDSVLVRIFNDGKFYIKEYVLTVNDLDYTFSDIWKNKYSEYKKIPYIWPLNESKTTVIMKRIIKYDEWMTTLKLPIDHVGEKKITTGKYTIEVKTSRKSAQLHVEENIQKE